MQYFNTFPYAISVQIVIMLLLFIGILILITGAHSLYSSNSHVIDLKPNNFDNLVLDSDNVWVVEFYAPWCGHCQQLTPEYDKAATALKASFILAIYICFIDSLLL